MEEKEVVEVNENPQEALKKGKKKWNKERVIRMFLIGIAVVHLFFMVAFVHTCFEVKKAFETLRDGYSIGDFVYKANGSNKNEVAVVGISIAGQDKEYLYIPEKITVNKQEFIVTRAGCPGYASANFLVKSDNLKFLYFPWTLCPLDNDIRWRAPKLERIFVTCNTCACYDGKSLWAWETETMDVIYSKPLFCKYYGETFEPILIKNSYTCRPANIAFMFNYDESPNNGYYSIDYLEGTGKVHEPLTPIREGYVFGGWYADEECTTVWDFDKTEVIVGESYNETRIYAKWIKN